MDTLVFIPNGLNTPEFEFLLSKSQELLNKNKKITILTCAGNTGYACSLNVYGMKSICIACKKRRNKGIAMLKGKFRLLEINKDIIKDIINKCDLNTTIKAKLLKLEPKDYIGLANKLTIKKN